MSTSTWSSRNALSTLPRRNAAPGARAGSLVPGLAHDAPLHLARAADGEDVRRPEPQRGGDGRVLAQAAVEVELVVDPDRREEQRDRGARERVMRADAVGAEEGARRRGGGMVRSGDVCMKTTVRPVDTSVHETVSARSMCFRRHARDGAPADLALHELRHGPHVEEAVALAAAEQHARQRDDLPHAEAEHPRELELASTAPRGGACRAPGRRGARRGSTR